MENSAIVSKILFLDRDYQPVGTRVIRRPGITSHTDRSDSKKIMAVGMGAFDDRDFKAVPRYWVAYEGDIKNIHDLRIDVKSPNRIERLLTYHFIFTSYHNIDTKIRRLMSFLGFKESYRIAEFKVHTHGWHKLNETIVSLHEGGEERFSLCDFLQCLHINLALRTDAIEELRRTLRDLRNDAVYVNYNIMWDEKDPRYHKLISAPALDRIAGRIHDAKKQMQTYERQRSYIQEAINLIMTSLWRAE